jgi:predicted nucleotidyltransferase component of viral defense system
VVKNHGVEDSTAEKVLWLSLVIHELSESPIKNDFALIGGSAIVFLYKDMYRFSTDLDLDFVGNRKLGVKGKNETQERQEKDRRAFQAMAAKLSMKFKEKKAENDRFLQYEFMYTSIFGKRSSVELDVSYRYCHAVLGIVRKPWPINVPGVLPSFSVQTLKKEELYASKVNALVEGKELERVDFPGKIGLMFKRKIRHLYDLYRLAEDIDEPNEKFDMVVFRNLIILFGMTRIKNFKYYRGNSIGSYGKDDVQNELKSVMQRGTPIPTVQEMKWQVRKFFDIHIFHWTEREHRFIEDFEAGNFRPRDLFDEKTARELKQAQYYKEILGIVRPL